MTAFRRRRVACIPDVSGIALVAQQGINDFLTGAGQRVIRTKKQQRMFERYQRQFRTGLVREQWAPDAH